MPPYAAALINFGHLLGAVMGIGGLIYLSLAVLPAASKEYIPHPREEHPKPCHASFPRRRLTSATVRAQFSVSASNCFRPVRVIA